MKRIYVYEVVWTDRNGSKDSDYFNSMKAAEKFKSTLDYATSVSIAKWRVWTIKDVY